MSTILSVSLPAEVRATLDAEARRQRRSRSFVVAEAVRDYVARQQSRAFDAARDRTLAEGLALAPAERIHQAEALWRELARGRRVTRPWVVSFDTFDEYEAWRREGREQA